MPPLLRVARPLAAALLLAVVAFGLWRLAGGMAGNPVDLLSSRGVPSASESGHILINEFGIEADTLWTAPADKPSERQVVAVVPHAAHYGIYATLSPDGRYIAYNALSPGLRDASADSPAEVWVMGVDGAYPRLLASDADLLVAPVWAPDSASVVIRRSRSWQNAAGAFDLVRVSLSGDETALLTAEAALFPVGFSSDGERLYYTQLSAAGTELAQVSAVGGTPSPIAHLGDDFTRDWRISPDGSRLAFLTPEESAAGTVLRAMVVDLDGVPDLRPALPGAGRPTQDFNPIWHPRDGDITVGRLTMGEGSAPAIRVDASGPQPLEAPSRGFDVPVAWSPDGGTLALRSFQGDLREDPEPWRLVLLDAQGQRREVTSEGEISFVGWVSGGK